MANYEYIKNLVEDLKVKYNLNNSELIENGAVHYMNGNDFTDFDWHVNNMVCEFVVFYKESEMGALKLNFRKGNTVSIYFFKNGSWSADDEQEMNVPFDVEQLAGYLYGTFDANGLFDKVVTDWEFSKFVDINGYEEEEDEYNYDYEEDEE